MPSMRRHRHGAATRAGRWRRRALALVLVALGWLGILAGASATTQPPSVSLLELEGTINPLAERYLARGLADAARAGRELVVVRLDTPGGTMQAMRGMTRAILGSQVPVAVLVAPAGAQAASAGMFLAGAAHVAAMAPGTNLGAAHPVRLGRGAEADDAVIAKAVNDAAALARAIAAERGRNADWYERAVRESVSATAAEALELGVIDLVVPDVERLLVAVDGRRVVVAGAERTLRTVGARVEPRPMSVSERLLQVITDPNVLYILLTLGLIGLAAELYNPGMIFPGVVGGVSLILALVAVGNLPINWGGALLLLIGVGLLFAELTSDGVGFLTVGGLIAFVLGSSMLYRPAGPPDPLDPTAAGLELSPWVIGAVTAVLAGLVGIVARAAVSLRHAPARMGKETLVGRTGVATSALTPRGVVLVDSESWSAIAEEQTIAAGEHVRVLDVEGAVLRVVKEEP